MMAHSKPSLKNDYNHCQNIIKHHSKSFYYAFSTLPEKDADAVYAIYAFCRTADDAIDHAKNMETRIVNLERLEKELDNFLSGNVPKAPMWRALSDVMARYDIDPSMLYTQLDGQRMDIRFKQPEAIDDLINYSNHVAGSVGRLLLPILSNDLTGPRRQNAEKLGVAMQITNILRDIGEDNREHGRIYIPKSVLKKHGYTEEQLASGEINKNFRAMWEDLAGTAEQLYDTAREEITYYKPEARLPLLLSLSIYREILNEVRHNEYDCFSKRNSVSLAKKIKIREAEKIYIKTLEDK
ncbi:phytoene/squalene synthase family protein [Salinicoccus siamensis]|uniref:4,4'-diapophytoene synthase n=1 Tax=Salinicoccus siamensis TaxID=381830 RepID=A0ABV5Z370_9STAP